MSFLLAIVAVIYVIVGYPLLLGWRSRRERPVRRGDVLPAVTAIIAVRNGEHYLAQKLDSLLALDYPADRLDVIVVSDGSTDRTEAIAKQYAGRGVQLFVQPPRGKPAAVTAGRCVARGEIVLLTDVRQVVAPDSLRHLTSNFADATVGVVSGDLVIRDPTSLAGRDIGLYWRYETWIRDRLGRLDSMFGATGPFYAIRRELLVPVPDDVLLDDMYVPLAAFFRGYRAIVDRRAVAYDYPTSRATEFRRKLRTLAGNYQILRHFPALLGPGNRMWFDYVSYKVGRLLLPFLLVWIAVASVALPDPWRVIVLVGQVAFYLLGGLDALVPERAPLKRLTSPIGTFVTMMVAAVGALAVFVVPAQRFWTVTSSRAPDALAGQRTP